MGVTGLWRLLEPAGRPVPLDTLRGKVLAVDISIWLHQMVKGFQDASGASIANSHLLGLFQRLCKLLYYGIRPIFVFDGCSPALKRQTIINRQQKKSQMHSNVDRVQKHLMEIITKHAAVNSVLGIKTSPTKRSPTKSAAIDDDDLFKLPALEEEKEIASSSESENESEGQSCAASLLHNADLHSIDLNSDKFKKLTVRERHDILLELKETRKQNSWGKVHELPVQSDNFSDYQMKRLLKRRNVQLSLEETEKEIGGRFLSINELEILLNEEGIDTKIDHIPTRQIASNENAHFILIKDVKEALNEATKTDNDKKDDLKFDIDVPSTSEEMPSTSKEKETPPNTSEADLDDEFNNDLNAAIALSLQCVDEIKPQTSSYSNTLDCSFLQNQDLEDSDSDDPIYDEGTSKIVRMKGNQLSMAKGYMKEFSGLTDYEIDQIINNEIAPTKTKEEKKRDKNNVILKYNKKEIESESSEKVANMEIQISDETNGNINKSENHSDTIEVYDSDSPKSVNGSESNDSDDNFEEVPELSSTLDRKGSNIIKDSKDDIFADIFEDNSKFHELDKEIITRIKKNIKKDDLTISTLTPTSTKIIALDTQNEDIPEEIDSQTDSRIITLTGNNTKMENQTLPAKDIIDLDKYIEDKPKIASSNELNKDEHLDNETTEVLSQASAKSPTKKMRLNDIQQLVRHDDDNLNDCGVVSNKKVTPITEEAIVEMTKDLEKQRDVLEKERNKLDRMGRNISDEMTKDAQELLKLFGIPYIIAPTEAEAQCAFLESVKLTDGTITDDSDIWLFGGKTVYRNFFNQQKQVLQFMSENIHSSFKMQREDFVLLALLVGSDYTLGVTGIGPVTALEILSAFPCNKSEILPPYTEFLNGLNRFRQWCKSRSFGHSTLRNKLKNISLSEEFPNQKVVEAYLRPEVETSKEPFSWGKLDLVALRDYTKEKFGWSRDKTEEVLNPVLKRLDLKNSQLTIKSFYKTDFKHDVTNDKMSKRVKKAIENMGNEKNDADETNNEIKDTEKKKGKRKIKGNDSNKMPKNKRPKANQESDEKDDAFKTPNKNERVSKLKLDCENTHDIESSNGCDLVHLSSHFSQDNQTKICIPENRKLVKIPQRENDKGVLLKNKLKAIELFRKSTKGPGFVKRRKKLIKPLKDDAELSESSSD